MRKRSNYFRRGFTMVEALLLVGVLGVTGGIVGQSLSTMSNSAAQNNAMLMVNDQLMAQMEYLRSVYKTLGAGWSNTSNVALPNGTSCTMTSTISTADPGVGSAQSNYLELEAQIGTQSMVTYASN